MYSNKLGEIMKTLVVFLALALSTSAFCTETPASIQGTTAVPLISTLFTMTSSGHKPFGKAQEIIRDANEYQMNGKLSIALAKSVAEIQSQNDVSESEAVAMLVEMAEEMLKLNY